VGIDEQALKGAAALIAHDLAATLGWETGQARAEARAALVNRAGLLATEPAWDDLDRATQRRVLDDVVVEAVEDLQQRLHDQFVDTSTSWPSCPQHPTIRCGSRGASCRHRRVVSSEPRGGHALGHADRHTSGR
jgi:hypothetical protein